MYSPFDRCQLGSNPSSARVFVGSRENSPLFRVEGGKVFAYWPWPVLFPHYDLGSGLETDNKTNTPIC